jgi:mannose-1-phosphate guanylyltransferase
MRGMILSAGLGERLRPITQKMAKPAVPFLNVPMLAFPLFWMEKLKLKSLVVNTHYLPDTVTAAARSVCDWDYGLDILHETEILGSAGGIWNARHLLGGDGEFVVANADAVFLSPQGRVLNEMLEFHRHTNSLATLLVCDRPGVGETFGGVWFDKRGKVTGFGKGPQPDLECLHFAGIMIFDDRLLSILQSGPINILYDILQPQIQKGERVSIWKEELKWFETGMPRDYLSATRECLSMLFDSEGVRWHLTDMLDRFSPGWRNFSTDHLLAKEKPTFETKFTESSRVLMGEGIHSETSVYFDGLSVLGPNLDLSGRTSTDGVYLSQANTWVR